MTFKSIMNDGRILCCVCYFMFLCIAMPTNILMQGRCKPPPDSELVCFSALDDRSVMTWFLLRRVRIPQHGGDDRLRVPAGRDGGCGVEPAQYVGLGHLGSSLTTFYVGNSLCRKENMKDKHSALVVC